MAEPPPFIPPVARWLWRDDRGGLSRWPARGLHVLRLIYAVARDVTEGYLTLHASGLVYASLLSFVPLLAFSFSVLKGLGVHNQLQPMLANALAPLGAEANEITGQVLGFVDNIQVGVLGAIGLGVLVYTAIVVVQRIERAFNEIWHVITDRTLFRKFTDYISVILVGPLLMFSALGLAASLQSSAVVQKLAEIAVLGTLIEWGGRMVPGVLVILALTFAYAFVPNIRVRIVPALVGAVIAGFLWAMAGSLFAIFVAGSSSYQAIYSAFATVIVFIYWMYLNWLIVLVGADIAFYLQHPEYVASGPAAVPRLTACQERERLALGVMATVGRAFYAGNAPPTLDDLRVAARIPTATIEEVLSDLEQAGLVRTTTDAPASYVPSVPLETTPLKLVYDAVRRPAIAHDLRWFGAEQAIRTTQQMVDQAVDNALRTKTIKDLVSMPASEVKPFGDPGAVGHPGATAGSGSHRQETGSAGASAMQR
jgi:membrane protein